LAFEMLTGVVMGWSRDDAVRLSTCQPVNLST
jgi:hypothetical protein